MGHEVILLLQETGISLAAGFRPLVPLMLVGLMGRAGALPLAYPFSLLSQDYFLLALGGLMASQGLHLRIPLLSWLLGSVETPLVLASGGVAAAAIASGGTVTQEVLVGVMGLFLAGLVHLLQGAIRFASRPLDQVSHLVGDALGVVGTASALVLSLAALIFPVMVPVVVLLMVVVGTILTVKLLHRAGAMVGTVYHEAIRALTGAFGGQEGKEASSDLPAGLDIWGDGDEAAGARGEGQGEAPSYQRAGGREQFALSATAQSSTREVAGVRRRTGEDRAPEDWLDQALG